MEIWNENGKVEVYIEVGGVSGRPCSINGIKCLLNGRLKKKCKILECRSRKMKGQETNSATCEISQVAKISQPGNFQA